MEYLLKLLEARISLNAILQIGIDAVILGLLVAIMWAKRPGVSRKDEAILASFGKIMEETAEISRKFEANLEKRKDLLQQITAKLDGRILEGENLCARLEQFSRGETERAENRRPAEAAPNVRSSDQQKVLSLAAKGLSAGEIAKRLKRPVGEVELILNLRKIAS